MTALFVMVLLLAHMKAPFKWSKEAEAEAYVLGGIASVLLGAIVGVFALATFDSYMLKNSSLAAVVSAVLVDLTNSDRSAQSISGLAVSPVLTVAAQAKANDMAAGGYFAHVSPDGKNSWYWFRQAGYTFTYAGENLAVDFSDSGDVERAWMNSPTHRRNILDANFTEIGIATAQGVYKGRNTTFVVQMFGTPARTAVVEPIRTIASPAEATIPAVATTEPAPAPVQVEEPVAAATTSVVVQAPTEPISVLGTEAEGLVAPVPSASWLDHLLASPKLVLQYGYYILAALVLVVLAYVTELEFHRRHTRHLVATIGLFALMIALMIIANMWLFSEPVIAAISR